MIFADVRLRGVDGIDLAREVKMRWPLGLEIPPSLLALARRGNRMKSREFITLIGGAANRHEREPW
jgi:hypothetical protein